MAFGNSANQLERTKGVKSRTAKFTQLTAVFFLRNLTYAIQESSCRCSMRVDEENLFVFRQMRLCKGFDLFCKFIVVNTGSQSNTILAGKICIRYFRHIDQRYRLICFLYCVQEFFRISMMFGIVDDSCFHTGSTISFPSSYSFG